MLAIVKLNLFTNDYTSARACEHSHFALCAHLSSNDMNRYSAYNQTFHHKIILRWFFFLSEMIYFFSLYVCVRERIAWTKAIYHLCSHKVLHHKRLHSVESIWKLSLLFGDATAALLFPFIACKTFKIFSSSNSNSFFSNPYLATTIHFLKTYISIQSIHLASQRSDFHQQWTFLLKEISNYWIYKPIFFPQKVSFLFITDSFSFLCNMHSSFSSLNINFLCIRGMSHWKQHACSILSFLFGIFSREKNVLA